MSRRRLVCGTSTRYRYGCRCAVCKKGWAAWVRKYRAESMSPKARADQLERMKAYNLATRKRQYAARKRRAEERKLSAGDGG
jgi:hypothetical protein